MISGMGLMVNLLAVKWIGLYEYGIFIGAFSVILFFERLLKSEIKSYLVKFDVHLHQSKFDAVYSFLVKANFLAMTIIVFIGVLIRFTDSYKLYSSPLLLLSVSVPLAVLTEIPRAILERELRFKLIGDQELLASMLQHVLTIIVILIYRSFLGLIIGWLAYNLMIFVLSWYKVSYKPVLRLGVNTNKDLHIHYRHMGLQVVLSESYKLINPFIIGGWVGPAGVGTIGLIEKLIFGLNFIGNVFKRVFNGLLNDLQEKAEQKINALGDFELYFALIISSLLFILGLFYKNFYWVIDDSLYINNLFGLIAGSYIIVQLSELYQLPLVLDKKYEIITKQQVIYISCLLLSSLLFINMFGLIGYGYAVLLSSTSKIYLFRKYHDHFNLKIPAKVSIIVGVSAFIMIAWM